MVCLFFSCSNKLPTLRISFTLLDSCFGHHLYRCGRSVKTRHILPGWHGSMVELPPMSQEVRVGFPVRACSPVWDMQEVSDGCCSLIIDASSLPLKLRAHLRISNMLNKFSNPQIRTCCLIVKLNLGEQQNITLKSW